MQQPIAVSSFLKPGRGWAVPAAVALTAGFTGGHALAEDAITPAPFQFQSQWLSTAIDGGGLGQGDPTTLTWGFVPDGTDIPGSRTGESSADSSLIAALDAEFGNGLGGSDLTQRPWFTYFHSALNRWEQVSGLTYVYEPNDDGSDMYSVSGSSLFAGPAGSLGIRGDLRIGGHPIDGSSGNNVLAYNFYPQSGEMVVDTDNMSDFGNTFANHRAFRNVIMHEHGHGLGINHLESSDSNQLMEPHISTAFDGPQFDDILSVQRLYGDAWEKNGGNDSAATATALGAITVGTSASIGTDADDAFVAATDTDFISIDDNSDMDFFSFTVSDALDLTLTLTPKGPTYQEGEQDGSQSTFFTRSMSNLTLALFDTDGATLLDAVNGAGPGVAELLSFALPDAGEYFVKVAGLGTTIQMYQLDAGVIPEPASLVLLLGAAAPLALRRRAV